MKQDKKMTVNTTDGIDKIPNVLIYKTQVILTGT